MKITLGNVFVSKDEILWLLILKSIEKLMMNIHKIPTKASIIKVMNVPLKKIIIKANIDPKITLMLLILLIHPATEERSKSEDSKAYRSAPT